MAQSDKQTLARIMLIQSEVARILKTSRQAVNAGIKSENLYLDINRLMLIHKVLVQKQDQRADLVAEILSDQGVQINEIGLNILGIVLRDEDATLISENKALRDLLQEYISYIITSGCERFRAGINDQKKDRDECRRQQLDHFIKIGAMNM